MNFRWWNLLWVLKQNKFLLDNFCGIIHLLIPLPPHCSFLLLFYIGSQIFFTFFHSPPPRIIFVTEVRCLCWYHHTCILILIRSLFKCSFWSVLCIELIKSRYTVVLFVFVCGGNTNRKWSKDVVLVSYKLYTSVSLWRGFDCRVCPVQKWGCHFLSSCFFFLFFF